MKKAKISDVRLAVYIAGGEDFPTGRQVSDEMVKAGFDRLDAQRMIQLCIDRGYIKLCEGLKLKFH